MVEQTANASEACRVFLGLQDCPGISTLIINMPPNSRIVLQSKEDPASFGSVCSTPGEHSPPSSCH